MRENSLLERIALSTMTDKGIDYEDPGKLADSVLRHLSNMLNTRRGEVQVQPDYGMPDFLEFASKLPDTISDMEMAITDSIRRFEPRLKNVRVRFVEDNDDILVLHFKVSAELVTRREEVSIIFDTSINSEGHIDVKG